jgi:hypothetical protein
MLGEVSPLLPRIQFLLLLFIFGCGVEGTELFVLLLIPSAAYVEHIIALSTISPIGTPSKNFFAFDAQDADIQYPTM